ncbi:GlsB/YeaQ/YmgE family stress response membrane protein [Brevibacillus laterosporus]|uniref:GlsB/YeaQ/YmgE family stress response membrane protein n=1 Tax=Brevibacillus laterosporus TaxID=1465 RepID=UPI00264D7D50|nr:GlsB/YeaQ/YmgE family stress response membrane protein [Brevibacillus laterosporus]MDN9011915.1 GlsB/YeaQ/YmgE family stress response membrane protein [Brevibacillus laterosporus]MDO0943011.1 GlsB/YeaQ/YmgE family stress response membrane protein [Brevibacillus laterosporus]
MLHFIIMIIMAIVIGILGDALVKNSMPGGLIGSMIAGFAGAWLGSLILGNWGPVIGGFAVIPAIIGAALFVFILGLFSRAAGRA